MAEHGLVGLVVYKRSVRLDYHHQYPLAGEQEIHSFTLSADCGSTLLFVVMESVLYDIINPYLLTRQRQYVSKSFAGSVGGHS
jgi:hypothetical protein